MIGPKLSVLPKRQQIATACEVKPRSPFEALVILRLRRACISPVELDRCIERFTTMCEAQQLCASITFEGLSNWRMANGTETTELYFSSVSGDDGHAENGNGIDASGSAKYLNIWATYVSS